MNSNNQKEQKNERFITNRERLHNLFKKNQYICRQIVTF